MASIFNILITLTNPRRQNQQNHSVFCGFLEDLNPPSIEKEMEVLKGHEVLLALGGIRDIICAFRLV